MVAIQLRLPEGLAEASSDVAHDAGLTRSEWIRRAIEHEIERCRALREKQAMAASLKAMRAEVQAEEELLDAGLPQELPREEGSWWKR